MLRCLSILCSIALACSAALAAEPPANKAPPVRTTHVDGARKLEIVDLTPRFLDFYRAAQHLDPDARWSLWEQKYGFAAVPPTPEGMKIARTLLDGAWSKYPDALAVVGRGAAGVEPQPGVVLKEVADLLGLTGPFEVQVLVYVGAFDSNAFTAGQDGAPLVAIPVEMPTAEREVVFRHEMTHAVHMRTAGLSGGWERSIAETIMQEGLAMHASKRLVPGRHDREYVEHSPGWYAAASAKAPQILEGIAADLEKSDSDVVFRYTMGTGNVGLEREAYFAAWLVVGELLKQGMTFPEIARIPSAEMAPTVRATIERLRRPHEARG